MSLERLKKYCEKIAKVTRILFILMIIIIVCESICFMWQALMPGKLTAFFNAFRIYAPFISDIDNNALCLFELGGTLFNNVFVFMILNVLYKMFSILKETISLSSITHELKVLASLLIAESIAVPIVKMVCYSVFVKLPIPSGTIDVIPAIVGSVLYFIAVIIQSKAVLKENRE